MKGEYKAEHRNARETGPLAHLTASQPVGIQYSLVNCLQYTNRITQAPQNS